MAGTVTNHEEAVALISQIAAEKPSVTFAIKIGRAIGQPGAYPTIIAHLSNATAAHLVSPETWLPTLSGGGNYKIKVLDPTVPESTGKEIAILTYPAAGESRSTLNRKAMESPDWRGPTLLSWPPAEEAKAPLAEAGALLSAANRQPPTVTTEERAAPRAGEDPELARLRAENLRLAADNQKVAADVAETRRLLDFDKVQRENAAALAESEKRAVARLEVLEKQAVERQTALEKQLADLATRLAGPAQTSQWEIMLKMEQERSAREESARRADREQAAADRKEEREREEKRLAREEALRREDRERADRERKDERDREEARLAREEKRQEREALERKEMLEKSLNRQSPEIAGLKDMSAAVSSLFSTTASMMQTSLDLRRANEPAPQEETTGDLLRALGEMGSKVLPIFMAPPPPQSQQTPRLPPPPGTVPQGGQPKMPADDGQSPSSQFMAPIVAQMQNGIDPDIVSRHFWDLMTVHNGEMTIDQVRLAGHLSRPSDPVMRAVSIFGDELTSWYASDNEKVEEYMAKFYDSYRKEAEKRGYPLPEDPAAEEQADEEPAPPPAPPTPIRPASPQPQA